jgi:hypothetical protein
VLLLDHLVERKIAEAMAEGAFDHLPGAGKPLALDDDTLVPEDLRVAYRILRNAGFLPPEVESRRELAGAAALLRAAVSEGERRRVAMRLALLSAKLEATGRSLPLEYRDRVAERFTGTNAAR